eukprot:scaffold5017_cov139-Isochrysis_galbana.AAC.7
MLAGRWFFRSSIASDGREHPQKLSDCRDGFARSTAISVQSEPASQMWLRMVTAPDSPRLNALRIPGCGTIFRLSQPALKSRNGCPVMNFFMSSVLSTWPAIPKGVRSGSSAAAAANDWFDRDEVHARTTAMPPSSAIPTGPARGAAWRAPTESRSWR